MLEDAVLTCIWGDHWSGFGGQAFYVLLALMADRCFLVVPIFRLERMFLQKYKHFYGCIDYYFFHSYIVQFLFLFFCFKMLIAEVVFLLHLVSTHVARIQTTAIFWRESTDTRRRRACPRTTFWLQERKVSSICPALAFKLLWLYPTDVYTKLADPVLLTPHYYTCIF